MGTKEGKIRIFYGDGKGKTSAALGWAFKRFNESGLAYVLMFNREDSEEKLLSKFEPEFKVFEFDKDTSLKFSKKVLTSKECDILVLDEIFGLLDEGSDYEDMIVELMELQKKSHMTLVLTGGRITDEIAKRADYITELTKIK